MRGLVRTIAAAVAAVGVTAIAAPSDALPALAPSGGTIAQITVSPADETDGAGMARFDPSASDDGRYVAFTSYSPSIVPGDDNGTSDIFLHDATTGVTKLISRNAAGAPANDGSGNSVLSANGKFIAFSSQARDLPGATPEAVGGLVYRYNVATERITLVSKAHTGALPNQSVLVNDISSDGRYVTFTTGSHNIVRGDHNQRGDVFRYDAATKATIKVSQTLTGAEPNKDSTHGVMSGDGRYVAYTSAATNMDPAGTPAGGGAYLYDTQTGTTTLVSHGSDGIARAATATGVSDNGKIVSMHSGSNSLAPGDTDKSFGVFFWNAATDQVKLVTTARPEWPNGVNALSTGVSGNGRYLSFDAGPADNQLSTDVYLFDRQTGLTTKLSVTPAGADVLRSSSWSSLSHNGNHVAFGSLATNLAPGDTQSGCTDVFLWSRTIA
jgi:hypothetical protein